MSKVLKVIALVTLSLVLVAGVALAGCAKKVEEMVDPTIAITQYLKGSTVDFDEATLNTMADGGGEAGFKNGTALTTYPTKFDENKDALAVSLFGDEAGLYHGWNTPYYDLLGPGDQQTVQAVFIDKEATALTLYEKAYADLTDAEKAVVRDTALTDAEAEVVESSVVSAIDGIDIDMSDAKLLVENIGYLTLYGMVSATSAAGWKADIEAEAVEVGGAGAVYAELTAAQKDAVIEALDLVALTMTWFAVQGVACNPAAGGKGDVAEAKAQDLYDKTYAELMPAEFAAVNDAVWATLTDAEKATFKATTAVFIDIPVIGVKAVFAQSTAVAMYPTETAEQVAALYDAETIAHETYATCTSAEQSEVNAAVYTALPSSGDPEEPLEKEFIDDTAVPGFFSLIQREMTDALPPYQNFAYTTLYSQVSPTSAYGWWVDVEAEAKAAQLHPTVTDAKADALYEMTYAELKDRDAKADELYEKDYADLTDAEKLAVDAAVAEAMAAVHAAVYATLTDDEKADVDAALVHPRQALYRWFAREGVEAMGAAASLIQLSVAEFSFKVTNPNEYLISLDSLSINFAIEGVDVAKLSLGDKVWVPAKEDDVAGEVTLRLLAPVKTYDIITWLVMEGKSSAEALPLAGAAFAKVGASTAVWDITCDVVVSTEADVDVTTITPDTYTLQWTPPVE